MASGNQSAGLLAALGLGAAALAALLRRALGPSGGNLEPVRQAALDACDAVVPSDYGDPLFQEMTDGKYQEGFGSSCGFLTSYVLQAIGCRDPRILNREEPAPYDLRYTPGDNISRLVQGAKILGAWRTLGADGPPEPGDLLFFSNGPPESEHVAVFGSVQLDADGNEYWETWDAGRTNNAGHQCARHLDALPGQGVPNETEMRRFLEPASVRFIGGSRQVVGYVSIVALPLVPELAPS